MPPRYTPEQIAKIIKWIKDTAPKLPTLEELTLNPHGPVSTKHVDLNPSKDHDIKLAGTLWSRILTNGKRELIEVPKSDFVSKYNTLAFGGIDFDTKFHLGALLKSLETLSLSSEKTGPDMQHIRAAAIYPNALRKERFEAAIEYNKNKLYYPSYAEKLTRELVLPRFLNDKGELAEPKMPLSFYSFSVGAREIMMVENALRHIFKTEHSCSDNDVSDLFTYLHANCVAYALDFDNLPEPRFSKNIVFSVDDWGVLYPKSLVDKVLTRGIPGIEKAPNACIPIPGSKLSGATNLIILKHYQVPLFTKDRKLSPVNSHSLPHYMEGMTNLKGLQKGLLGTFKALDDPDYDGSSDNTN